VGRSRERCVEDRLERRPLRHDWQGAYRKYVAADPSAVPRVMELEEEEVVE
jgi:hypothetical protein